MLPLPNMIKDIYIKYKHIGVCRLAFCLSVCFFIQ